MAHLASTSACPLNVLSIEHLRVRKDRVVATVVCTGAVRHTTPAIAAQATKKRPNLLRHTCVNSKGSTFGDCIDHTPLPHLLEHVVVDILATQSNDTADVFVGTTTWIDADAGRAQVSVSMRNDVDTLRAFKDALQFVNSLQFS